MSALEVDVGGSVQGGGHGGIADSKALRIRRLCEDSGSYHLGLEQGDEYGVALKLSTCWC